ncbi:MAG: tetratricopeptide repeat protein [Deltaproteobacteria bacterium]|nr:tetratricopeptide repeat protein [Deltaproteobacteria bacterium]
MANYSSNELKEIYRIAKLYYEMGYIVPAEKLFWGIVSVRDDFFEAHLGLGVIYLEKGQVDDAAKHFRRAMTTEQFAVEAKIGLALSFIATSSLARAQALLAQMAYENLKSNVLTDKQKSTVAGLLELCLAA